MPCGRRRLWDKEHRKTWDVVCHLGLLHRELERYDEAEQVLRKMVDIGRHMLCDDHPHTLESWNNLIELYEASGKPELAEEWRAKLPQETRTKE